MILTCTECETKFLIEAKDLGDRGRRVRCGNCGSIWFVKPPEPEKIAAEKEIAKEQQANLKAAVAEKAAGKAPSLPSTVVTMTVPAWLKAAVWLLVVANMFTFVVLNKKLIGQTSFYDLIGQYDTRGVEITDAKMVIGDEKGQKIYNVLWSVANTTKETRQLPARRIKLLDKDLKVIAKNADKLAKTMDAGQKIELAPNNIPNASGNVKYIVMDIGNPYELGVR